MAKKISSVIGYSTLAALIFYTFLILLVMIPTLIGGANEFVALTLLSSITVWSHVVLGTTVEILGILLVAAWLRKGPSKMTCALE